MQGSFSPHPTQRFVAPRKGVVVHIVPPGGSSKSQHLLGLYLLSRVPGLTQREAMAVQKPVKRFGKPEGSRRLGETLRVGTQHLLFLQDMIRINIS
jgi:hypothetical protein